MEVVTRIKPKDKPYYVSNPELYKVYCDWHAAISAAKLTGAEEPQIPKFIAESILKISTRLAFRPNFMNYSFRDDMIGDAIENCIRTAKNFNPEKSNNPFSFITTIAWHAFVRRIQAEQKQTVIKSKIIEDLPIEDFLDVQEVDEDTMSQHNQFVEFLRENSFISVPTQSKKRKQKLHEEIGLEEFFAGEVPFDILDESECV